jgi:murein DD-endopeptidase MepM/ murein hydrolase activator NlpD
VSATLVFAPVAAASVGGATVPSTSGGNGGTEYGQPVAPSRDPRPVASLLKVTSVVTEGRALPSVRLRIEQKGVRTVRARLVLWPARRAGTVLRVDLGRVRTGRVVTVAWPKGTSLRAGTYTVRLHAKGPDGAPLLRRAKAPGRAVLVVRAAPRKVVVKPVQVPVAAPVVADGGVFPVQGPYSLGGEDAGFGAARDGHTHEGQDISAARGVPVVAPVAGTIRFVEYQKDGAGWYVVEDADDGRSFFFAHCRAHTVVVAPGLRVSRGARLCDVGNTGASVGPHLHFEIWVDGWRVDRDSRPVDPLAQLQAWAA